MEKVFSEFTRRRGGGGGGDTAEWFLTLIKIRFD
jgi:hypothetical protein